MEILETGASGSFRLELTVREGEDGSAREAQLRQLLSAVEAGDIRLGANKNRGFGRLRITAVFRKEFSAQNVSEWIARQDDGEKLERTAWYHDPEERFVVFRVPLSLTGGISIRKYSARPGEADFEHISCAGKPVVPGTSWNGAIRSRAKELLAELGYPCNKLESAIAEWFGYVDAGSQNARQSQVVISESVIEGGAELEMTTRNKISRFDASTIESALYQERSHFGGDTELEIKVRKQTMDCGAICGLLLLVIQDIQNGYLPVGGQTAVGRGIFSGKRFLPVSEEEQSRYLSELSDFIKGGM
ncbi:MAG: RAMP superfamily CRISPR-associated protein [Lachnospiraceae bacterium]|nr:RAMP superfamily CRISPR-associated protein [Lachnospiraceae bacterium]